MFFASDSVVEKTGAPEGSAGTRKWGASMKTTITENQFLNGFLSSDGELTEFDGTLQRILDVFEFASEYMRVLRMAVEYEDAFHDY